MKKRQIALREILYRNYEKGERFLNQKSISEDCNLSLGTVNSVIKKLENFGAIEKKPLGFRLRAQKKVLLYWAATRDLQKDIIYKAYSPTLPKSIESKMPKDTIFTAYSGYKNKLGNPPSDYSKIYVYGDPKKISQKFKQEKQENNIYVLELDERLEEITNKNSAPLVQIYADLWQLPPPASRFLREIKKELKPKRTGIGIMNK
ncbi:MAG: winged helix-turn-helix transcriptional regulator [Hadesarchaea archaeon]|nr:winged helix-turn-helix transcriptional regulator [Hadesarchaea archaeon]